jgi:hypothetical protein
LRKADRKTLNEKYVAACRKAERKAERTFIRMELAQLKVKPEDVKTYPAQLKKFRKCVQGTARWIKARKQFYKGRQYAVDLKAEYQKQMARVEKLKNKLHPAQLKALKKMNAKVKSAYLAAYRATSVISKKAPKKAAPKKKSAPKKKAKASKKGTRKLSQKKGKKAPKKKAAKKPTSFVGLKKAFESKAAGVLKFLKKTIKTNKIHMQTNSIVSAKDKFMDKYINAHSKLPKDAAKKLKKVMKLAKPAYKAALKSSKKFYREKEPKNAHEKTKMMSQMAKSFKIQSQVY